MKSKIVLDIVQKMGGYGTLKTIYQFGRENGITPFASPQEIKETIRRCLEKGSLKGQLDWWIGLPNEPLPIVFDGNGKTRLEMLEQRVWELERVLGYMPIDRTPSVKCYPLKGT